MEYQEEPKMVEEKEIFQDNECSQIEDGDCGWLILPYDIHEKIFNSLVSIYDRSSFSLVAKSWYSLATQNKHKRQEPQCPLLIVPPNYDGTEGKQSFYNFAVDKILGFNLDFPCIQSCFGSSHGWLIMVGLTLDIILFNPFLGKLINLPPLVDALLIDDDEPEKPYYSPYTFKKAILTKDPILYPNDYMVAAIYGDNSRLAIMKANDKNWIHDTNQDDFKCFEDVNVHNGIIYALDQTLRLLKVEVDDGNSTFSLIMVTGSLDQPPLPIDVYTLVYFVESSRGDLLLVQRFVNSWIIDLPEEVDSLDEEVDHLSDSKTLNFKVYKVSDTCEDGMRKHVEVKSLDNDAMFVGYNRSMCVSTEEFPECLPNRIYYTNNFLIFEIGLTEHCPQDIGIFNLEDGKFDTHYVVNRAQSHLLQPTWIIPTFNSSMRI